MRKLFWQMNVTLDGFMEGPNRELDHTAQVVDADLDRCATEMLKPIDVILLGRRTYQTLAAYWPSATGPDADRLNKLPKVVFSKTLEGRMEQLKAGQREYGGRGRQIEMPAGQGSCAPRERKILASTFMQRGLVDKYRILVTPFVLGGGTPMFKGISDRIALKLLKATTWSSGVVALYYQKA